MHNHLYHILRQWQPLRDEASWVLAAVYSTQGSVYRKAGALMLLSDCGHQLGLLSGGCLEADLQLQAMRVLQSGKSQTVRYDAGDEGGLAWRLGIGCGGAADIVLHPCNRSNEFLALNDVYQALTGRQRATYLLSLAQARATLSSCAQASDADALAIPVQPPIHLAVFGAGPDALPIVEIAANLGWLVTVVDKRPANARQGRFPRAQEVLACPVDELPEKYRTGIDAAIVINHNLTMDAAAIAWLQGSSARYIGLLGPRARRQQVLDLARIGESDLRVPVAGPLGLDLGGELPESIALSALAECHAVLFGRSARALSGML